MVKMAREILFRGKEKSNGKWVYGYYTELPTGSLGATIASVDEEIICEDTASFIIEITTGQHRNHSSGYPMEVVNCETYEVLLETIGQYTGTTDKNGKKIFEGDIVLSESDGFCCDDYGVIRYYADEARFVIEFYTFIVSFEAYDKDFEIIGNVYDNSELVEWGNKNEV